MKITITRLSLSLAIFLSASPLTQACTIFTLTDTNHVLFCNNEDWKDPETRIWFVPGGRRLLLGSKRFGCAYVGFGNMWPQGGVNTEGLAFDWVAGYKEKWEKDPKHKMKSAKANVSAQLLETCATVEEAVTFFQSHWNPHFSYSKILVADRTGASAIIGAKDNRLDIQVMKKSRGFGYGGQILEKMLAKDSPPTLTNTASILNAARQQGQYATKYSNVFDLRSGDIFLFCFPEQPEPVKLSLAEELKQGRHFYNIPKVKEELDQHSK